MFPGVARRLFACRAQFPLLGELRSAVVPYKAYPFEIVGVRQRFSVEVTWFTKKPGSGMGFEKAASSFLKVRP